MKAQTIPFTFLRARPDEIRGEQLNVGVVAFLQDGPKVYVDAPSWRVRALHPDLDVIDWPAWAEELESALGQLSNLEQQFLWLQHGLGVVRADDQIGSFFVGDGESLHETIESLVAQTVSIPHRTLTSENPASGKPRNRLHTQLKSWFRASRIFSPKVSDLSNGKIVPSYPIDAAGDLYADFALKNGSIHVIEALDFRGVERVTKSLRGEAGLAAILFDQAARVLPEGGRRLAVVAADDYGVTRPVVGLVGRYADDLFMLESKTDRQRLADFLASSLKIDSGILPFATDERP